ncbi:MAG TPA: acetylglutamate kinase [Saprospiraceae bacterium]|nr:acetylglutamate kinase [Saprospiraceae bacterium]HMQ83293.1 acetylglutamate kinase [Saprospiraceae bacterium]
MEAKPKLRIIKIGGNVIDDKVALRQFLSDFAALSGHKILVHGGGKLATQLSQKLGIAPQLVEGRRITSADDLEIVTMVYAGWINKSVVALLQSLGCSAIGLSGADGNSMQAKRRSPEPIDFGWVGDVEKVNAVFIQSLLEGGHCPVFCPITHDAQGHLLNTNADTIAAELGIAMSAVYAVELLYCFEKKGVLANVADENSVISFINPYQYAQLKSAGAIHQGMLPKMDNAFRALNLGVSKVKIGSASLIAAPADTGTELTV